ncbi:MAG: SbcC/MukB-like Walker B domain-containing protein [Sulfurimonas sp.]|nr:SbcC/MukB-like Walker B domain-containing protein [Sulfurimonas sp.]
MMKIIKKEREYKNYKDNLSAFIARFKIALLNAKIDELKIELIKTESKKTQADALQEELYSTLSDLKLELKQNGGDRLNSIDSEIKFIEKSLEDRKKQNLIYNTLAKKLQMQTVSSEHRFLHNNNAFKSEFEGIDRKIDKFQNDKVFEVGVKKRYEESAVELKAEVAYLENNRSNIPQRISKLRDAIASHIGVKEDKLPFIGELIEVQDEKWNGAIERVLNSFALCLLVDSAYYDDVSAYVDATHLGAKLVYLKVDTKKQDKQFVEILPSSLINKIEVKADSLYFNQLNTMLRDRFNIPCVDTMLDFRRFKKALSINGQFKTNFSRHEKDDRFDIDDSRRWVLGWDNAIKLEQTKQDLEDELQKVELLEKNIQKLEFDIKSLGNSRDDLRDILKFESFELIDWYSLAKKIEELKNEKEELQKSSDTIKYLQDAVVKKEIEIKTQKNLLDELSQRLGKYTLTLQTREEELAFSKLIVNNADDLENVQEKIESLLVNQEKLNLNTISTYERNLKAFIDKELESLRAKLERNFKKIIQDMNHYKQEFQAQSKDFDSAIESLEEFRKKLNELKKDNLPKWEKKFHSLFREKTIQNILIVQSELDYQANEIKSKIQKINTSLKDIEYNDGSYITLEVQKSISQDIREFRESLKNSIEGSIGDDSSFDERKFLLIKEIIQRLSGREGKSELDKKWRKVVTDVRNWFDFSAMERYISDDSDKEYYPHSGGKSGGQKEKLAYTVLASSLAFQFGLEYDKVQSRSFRFVMIDEAFGRGSDESTKYALRLF